MTYPKRVFDLILWLEVSFVLLKCLGYKKNQSSQCVKQEIESYTLA